jgi:hypothetical protein
VAEAAAEEIGRGVRDGRRKWREALSVFFLSLNCLWKSAVGDMVEERLICFLNIWNLHISVITYFPSTK